MSAFDHAARHAPRDSARAGTVHLVGAGPGDPGLLTMRAVALLRTCDIVFHDYLVSDAVLDHVSREALRVNVGKVGHGPAADQDAISASLVQAARAGLRVVRLKGGDPFVFGRGAEEALVLADANVPFEIVPGVSALAAVPASAGIPLTHRGMATSIGVVAGACAGDGRLSDAVGRAAQADTVVAFMARANLTGLAEAMLAAGRSATTPAAAIMHGTTSAQRTVVSTLAALPAEVRAAGLRAPMLVVVGDVVSLHARLAPESAVATTACGTADAPAAAVAAPVTALRRSNRSV